MPRSRYSAIRSATSSCEPTSAVPARVCCVRAAVITQASSRQELVGVSAASKPSASAARATWAM